jgi:hypothetical protein
MTRYGLALFSLASVLTLTGCSRPTSPTATDTTADRVSLSATIQKTAAQELWLPLVGCTPSTCGGYSQNLATLTFRKADAAHLPNGRLRVRIMSLADLATGNIAAGKTLEVFVGFFDAPPSDQWWFSIGHVTVDQRGNVNEFVMGPDGVPYVLRPDVPRPFQIILNDPGERSEFATAPFTDS